MRDWHNSQVAVLMGKASIRGEPIQVGMGSDNMGGIESSADSTPQVCDTPLEPKPDGVDNRRERLAAIIAEMEAALGKLHELGAFMACALIDNAIHSARLHLERIS